MTSIGTFFSKIRSLGLDREAFFALPEDRRVDRWRLNSPRFNLLYAERRIGVKVVDLGCGPPSTQARIREEAGAENYLGIDYSIENKPGLVADVAHLPFANKTLNLVRSFSMFEHTYNYKQIIDDIYRVLRPGGSLFVQVPFLLEFHGFPSDYFRFTHIALQRILQDAGFKIVDYDIEYGRGFFVNLTKILEHGSFCFPLPRTRWFWLRFVLRGLSRVSWKLRWLDKHYTGSLYASVLMLGEKPIPGEQIGKEEIALLHEPVCVPIYTPPVHTPHWKRLIKAYRLLLSQGPRGLGQETVSYWKWKTGKT
jgi:SAM-dependent methyltransferase